MSIAPDATRTVGYDAAKMATAVFLGAVDIAADEPVGRRLALAFTELAKAI